MNCDSFQERLQDFLDGKLQATDRLAADSHLDACPHCKELVGLMRLRPDDLEPGTSPDLVDAVLARTSGSACERARELLAGELDVPLESIDSELLRGHLDGCHPCAALAAVLARLPEDLAALGGLVPDERFVQDVLDSTLPRPGRWAGLAARLAQGWTALLERPRIAWELAYVGTMAGWLVVGAFGSPLRAASDGLPSEAPKEVVRTVKRQVSNLGHEAWSATGARGIHTLDELHGGLTERLTRAELVLDDLRLHGTELGTAALDLDVKQSGKALKKIKGDARSIWQSLAADNEDEGRDD